MSSSEDEIPRRKKSVDGAQSRSRYSTLPPQILVTAVFSTIKNMFSIRELKIQLNKYLKLINHKKHLFDFGTKI